MLQPSKTEGRWAGACWSNRRSNVRFVLWRTAAPLKTFAGNCIATNSSLPKHLARQRSSGPGSRGRAACSAAPGVQRGVRPGSDGHAHQPSPRGAKVAAEPGPVLPRAERQEVRRGERGSAFSRSAAALQRPWAVVPLSTKLMDPAETFPMASCLRRCSPATTRATSRCIPSRTSPASSGSAPTGSCLRSCSRCASCGVGREPGADGPPRSKVDAPCALHRLAASSRTKPKRPLLPPPLPQRRDIPIESRQVEAVISAEGDAASDMLQLLYAFINSDAFT